MQTFSLFKAVPISCFVQIAGFYWLQTSRQYKLVGSRTNVTAYKEVILFTIYMYLSIDLKLLQHRVHNFS